MIASLVYRTLRTARPKCLAKFAWNFGVKGLFAVERHRRRMSRGECFPPFLYLSITSACNLRCQGCWVDVAGPRVEIDFATLNRTIRDAKAHGNCFFGILGGEPFMHPQLLDLLAEHSDCYFQIFTNGQFLTDKIANQLADLGNATPLISIEGLENASDVRRGKKDVFRRSLGGLEASIKAGLLTGVATSVCQSNINELLTESWLRELIRRGAHYAWFHTYRPVGPMMMPELALSPDQLVRVRRFVVEMRARLPIGIVDAYYDHNGNALCPMAIGISHHVGPGGDIEPCPILQFAVENIRDSRGVFETIRDSEFLKDFRRLTAQTTRGCIIMERPDLVKQLSLKHGARDTTTRQKAFAELDAIQPRFSQWLPGQEVPETHWLYRLGKKFWFNDYGAYETLSCDSKARARELSQKLASSSPQPTVNKAAPKA
jgi:MoaA/NifB/PqqE/SkfB family radical SAM enzyme